MLYIVPTPIGNLEDITLRAIRVLKEVDRIYAEDTRTTKHLLNHYDIVTSLSSFHIHNEHKVLTRVIDELKNGQDLALVSDAGTPGISDPGFLLIREAVKNDIEYTVLPGATAMIPALLLSGFPCNEFYFVGFLPHKKGRQKKWQELIEYQGTIVLYESPYRIVKLSKEIVEYKPNTAVSLAREISKMHEEVWRGKASEFTSFLESKKIKGEMVVVISPPS